MGSRNMIKKETGVENSITTEETEEIEKIEEIEGKGAAEVVEGAGVAEVTGVAMMIEIKTTMIENLMIMKSMIDPSITKNLITKEKMIL